MYHDEFSEAVDQAERNFLVSMAQNIRRLIGKTIDQVDDAVSSGIDVAGFISWFISENSAGPLMISMEAIMTAQMGQGMALTDFIHEKTEDLIMNSLPMYRERDLIQTESEAFGVIFVPDNCLRLKADITQYLHEAGLSAKFAVRTSTDRDQVHVVQVTYGLPLYAYEFIGEMEKAYEAQMADPFLSAGIHLKPEWADRCD